MAKDAGSPLLTAHLWTLVAYQLCQAALAGYGQQNVGGLALPDGEFAGAGYQCAAYSRSDSPLLLIISSIGFGGTFMGRHLW